MNRKNTPSLVERTAALLDAAHRLHQEALADARTAHAANYHPAVKRLVLNRAAAAAAGAA